MRSALGARFWRIWIAAGVSTLGDGMREVAMPLLAASITRDSALVAAVSLAGRLPLAGAQWGTMPIGAAVGGALAKGFGLRAPFYVSAGVLAVMGVAALPVVNRRTIEAAAPGATSSFNG